MQYSRYPYKKKHLGCVYMEKKPSEDTEKKWPSASQGEGPQAKIKPSNTLILDLQPLEL